MTCVLDCMGLNSVCCPDPIAGTPWIIFPVMGWICPDSSRHPSLSLFLCRTAGQRGGKTLWPVRQTRASWTAWGWIQFLWGLLSLHLLAMVYMESDCCLMDGHRQSSTIPAASILAADCTSYTGFPHPSHLGEFEYQSSMIHFAVLPGNSGKKKKICQTSFASWMKEWMDYWIKAEPEMKPSCLNTSVYSQVSRTLQAFSWKQI